MKRTMILLLPLLTCLSGAAQQQDSLLVVFWNLENFYDWKDGGLSDSDREFSAEGFKRWTPKRFYSKCNGIAKILILISESYGRIPDAVGLAEVENPFVLRQLIESTVLHRLGYKFIHYDSPDRRGIDCALLYRKDKLRIKGSSPVRLHDSSGVTISTRDILLCEFEGIDILVNHHPSKVGDGSSGRRTLAMNRLNETMDSLSSEGHTSILAIGDFNDDVWGDGTKGTIKYHGDWEKIDGHFARGIGTEEKVFYNPVLMTEDRTWGGTKPLRTYVGPRYQGGISDHLPIIIRVGAKNRKGAMGTD